MNKATTRRWSPSITVGRDRTAAGDTIAFAYDTLNRMCSKSIATTTSTACGGTSASPLTLYVYDQAGHLIGANDNSAAITAVAMSARFANTYTYDALNRPVSATWSPAAAQTAPTPPTTSTSTPR